MKYKLTDNKKEYLGRTLYQIQSLRDIPACGVKAGDLGGYIEKDFNLNQEGNAWVSGNALVYGDAQVSGNALVYGDAWVFGNAQVSGNALVYGDAWVSGNAQVSGNALVYGDARVYDNAQVYGDALVSGNARVYDNAQVYGDALVSGNARVSGNALVESRLDLVYLTAPKYDLTITNAGLSIGCEFHSVEYWICNYAEIGKNNLFTGKEIKHYLKLIKIADKMFKDQQKLKED